MIIELAGQQNKFFFSEDMELLFAAENLLLGEPNHNLCSKTYGADNIATWKTKYNFLFEVCSSLNTKYVCGMLEQLVNCSLEQFSLAFYGDLLLRLEPEEFLYEFFHDIPKDEIIAARKSDEQMQLFYTNYMDISKSFLGLAALLQNPKRLISDFISFSSELYTDNFKRELENIKPRIQKEQVIVNDALKKIEPLSFSEQLMGKTFHNRGPYKSFTFSPSLYVPYKSIRFFDQDQILFYTVRDTALKDEDVQKRLKAISDGTRFQIIAMLNKNGPMRGMDIAAALSIAASTVSHHMDILYKEGMINEEQDKNTKYYSISRNSMDSLLNRLTDTFGSK